MKNHEGWRDLPVSVGGVSVSPGDYICGDSDGIIVISKVTGAEICALVQEQRVKEESREERVRNGETLASIIGLKPLEE